MSRRPTTDRSQLLSAAVCRRGWGGGEQEAYRPQLATRCSCLQTEVEQKAYYRSQSATQYSCLQTEVEHAGLLQTAISYTVQLSTDGVEQAYYRPQLATHCSCLQMGVEQEAYRPQLATQCSCLQTEVEHAGLLQTAVSVKPQLALRITCGCRHRR